jgi:multicomponent Na+:H+ antiporter subunit D
MLIYMSGHGLVKGALFLLVGIVLDRLGSADLPALHGRGHQMHRSDQVWVGILLVLGALGLAGVPPFATFTGKALMESAQPSAVWLPYVFTLTSGLTAGAVLRAGASVFLGWGSAFSASDIFPARTEGVETKSTGDRVPLTMLLVPTLMLGGSIVLGIIPGVAVAAQESAARFLESRAYRALILHNMPFPMVKPVLSASHGINVQSLSLACMALGIGLMFATMALFLGRLPALVRGAIEAGKRSLSVLDGFHSGDIRDYVSWLLLGAALLGFTFTAILTVKGHG